MTSVARDTSGELATRVSAGLAVTAFAVALLAPLVSPVEPEADPLGETVTGERVTLVEREGAVALLAALGLTVASAAPLLFRGSGMFKVVQRLAAATLVLGVLMSLTLVGFLFIPSAALTLFGAMRREEDHPLRPRDL